MQATVVPGISMWSAWQPARNFFFNSFHIRTPEGNLVIDPLPAEDALLETIAGTGGIDWIVVTNRDHERATAAFVDRFGAKVAASEEDAPLLGVRVDRTLREDDLILGARVLTFRGLKTSGEIALWFRDSLTAIVGDSLWGDPAGSLRVMPAEKLADPNAAVLSLRRLRALYPQHLLVGDGACVFGSARAALQRAFEAHKGAYVHRVNLDELQMVRRNEPGFSATYADVGGLIGAEKLGYRAVRLDPGDVFCPLHWHSVEEELFIVLEGTPSIRTSSATWELRAGDLVAFPTRPEGAHQLRNDSRAAATLILVGLEEPWLDDCFYPDSQKALIGSRDIIVRDHPELDYYDGE